MRRYVLVHNHRHQNCLFIGDNIIQYDAQTVGPDSIYRSKLILAPSANAQANV